jgi:peptide/nickel transport system permease protein
VEELIMRASDFTFAFPALLTAIMLTAIYGPGLVMSIVAIGIFNIPVFARITRGAANAVWARDYMLAARAAGKGAVAHHLDHVLPNIASQLIVQASISFATAILAEAALSYLGLGTQPPQAQLGPHAQRSAVADVPGALLAVYPGVAIVLSVLGLNLMGDGLRDLMDPKLSRKADHDHEDRLCLRRGLPLVRRGPERAGTCAASASATTSPSSCTSSPSS